ncbi:hypothetical protein GJAV_G00076050 [Gymnothorax javanicus]|nr:hypothetical protein GJAV_G00076050 [Gymnothorax javanicus]
MMRTFAAFILTLLGAHCEKVDGPNAVVGLVGHTVNISCTYDKQFRYSVKQWCNIIPLGPCVKKASTDGSVTDSRFSIRDEKLNGAFHVTIASLRMEDKGWYQCVIHRSIFTADYTHNVFLNVSMGLPMRPFMSPPPGTDSGSDALVTMTWVPQIMPTARPGPSNEANDSSVAGVWAVIRWVLFSMMLAGFFTVIWWKRK